jgi:hypothetical protein
MQGDVNGVSYNSEETMIEDIHLFPMRLDSVPVILAFFPLARPQKTLCRLCSEEQLA